MAYQYDYIMSLGYNCEVSFRLIDYYGTINPFLYSWSFELDRELFLKSLLNINSIFTEEISVADDHMFKCDQYQIKFHPRYEIFPQYGEYTKEQYDEALKELQSRISHLKEKTITAFQSDKKKLFFIKVENKGEENNIEYIKNLYSTLKNICYKDSFTIVCVLEKKALTKKIKRIENTNLLICSLRSFAPKKHTDVMGDLIGWSKIFNSINRGEENSYFKNVLRREMETIPQIIMNKINKLRK